MLSTATESRLNIKDFFRVLAYKRDFAKNHPYFFKPCGTCVFCGAQGLGKTLSAVDYTLRVLSMYPNCILVSNVKLKSRPFNAFVDLSNGEEPLLRSLEDGSVISSESILEGRHKAVTVEYWGLDSLKYVSNGEYGVIYLIDEIHLELNSLESKNLDISVIVEISQQRKQRKHIVCTSQMFMRMAKPLREQIADVVICRPLIDGVQLNRLVDGASIYEDNGKAKFEVKKNWFFFHSPELYEEYDTFAKMRRYNQEWQGKPVVNTYREEIIENETRNRKRHNKTTA